ncbi:MAG: DNA-binding response OmpR family regulator [Candidatus Poriferisodalaceae bacterium]
MTKVLLASDANWVIDEVSAALSDPGTELSVLRAGVDVRPAVSLSKPDLVILDLQIGNMGGMATCLDLRLESEVGRLPYVPVLILLDRTADLYLAQQAKADGWLVKPIDAFRLKMAAVKLLSGEKMSAVSEAPKTVPVEAPPIDQTSDSDIELSESP